MLETPEVGTATEGFALAKQHELGGGEGKQMGINYHINSLKSQCLLLTDAFR